MPKFAANLSMMYPEFEVPDRFKQAHRDGFKAIEFLQPYAHGANEMRDWLAANQLQLILINTPMGDVRAGERGLAALPGREADFEAAMNQALDFATALSVPMIHLMAGVVPAGESTERARETFIGNVRRTADRVQDRGIRLLLEPLNQVDLPGYLYSTADQVVALMAEIDRPDVQLQYDFYHLQLSQGNLAAGLREHLDLIGHIQFSSVPGRFEPQYGEVNIPFLFEVLDEIGYDGWVGCEYRPKTTTAEGLKWAVRHGLGRSD